MSGAFFAEISAKVCHHNIHVAREGCTMLHRLLCTDVSALLILSEGKLLALLQDVLSGMLLGSRTTIAAAAGGGSHSYGHNSTINDNNAFGQGMRPGADGRTTMTTATSSAAAAASVLPPLGASVWQECELVTQIIDVLMLFSERLLSFVGPQSSNQQQAIAAMYSGGSGTDGASSNNPFATANDNFLRHLDNADMFFLSFASVLSAVIALPPRRGLVAMTQGRFRAAFHEVIGWCNDISPFFVSCVLTAFGADSNKGRSEAALRVLMLANGFIKANGAQPQQQQPVLSGSGTIYAGSGSSYSGPTATITDAATAALNRLGAQKSLLVHKIEGFFLSKTNGPASGFSNESAMDVMFYIACRRVWKRREARVKALMAPHISKQHQQQFIGSGGGGGGYFADGAGAEGGQTDAAIDATIEEPEGISVISGNVSYVAGAGGPSDSMHFYGGGGVGTSALNKTPTPVMASAATSSTAASPSQQEHHHQQQQFSAANASSQQYPLVAVQTEVEAIRKQLESAQSHESFCDGLSRLWGAVSSAVGNGVRVESLFAATNNATANVAAAAASSAGKGGSPNGILRSSGAAFPQGGPQGFQRFFLDCFRRVFTSMPANTTDGILFHWTMRLLGHLLQLSTSTTPGPDAPRSMRAVILSNCCSFLVAALNAGTGQTTVPNPIDNNGDSMAAMLAQRRNAPSRLTLISTEMEILSFLRIAEECSTSSQLESWVRAGLFSAVISYVEPFGASSSLLTDAPTLHDGSLSEDVYLASAIQTCRSEGCALAASAMKLLCSVVTNHAAMLCEVFPAESYSCVDIAVPMLSRVAINNPTVEISPQQAMAMDSVECKSLVYRLPRSQRSSRYTPVGECAVLALDALLCLPLCHATGGRVAESLIPFLPSLARATVRSVFPHLRGTLFRLLTRTINSASELLNLVKTMPSAVASAVAVVISYDGAKMREWEVSAAAEWLAQVLRLTVADSSVAASFNFLQTALPLKLLQMSTMNGASYVSGTLLSLLMGIVKQQQLLTTAGGNGILGQHSALAPQSARSLPHWRTLTATAVASLRATREKWAQQRLDESNDGSSTTISQQQQPQRKKGNSPTVTMAADVVVGADGTTAAPSSYGSSDAPHRYIASMEAVTSRLLFVNGVLRGLSLLFYHHQDLREHFSQEEALELLEHCLMCPTPEVIATTMAEYYRTELLYSKPLQRAFEQMLSSLCALFTRGWYSGPPRDVQHYPLPIATVLVPMARLMADKAVGPMPRQCVAALISTIVESAVPHHTELTASVMDVADALFLATTCLPPSPATIAAQCRLVAAFHLANKAAFSCGWVDLAIRTAYQIVVGRVVMPVNGRIPESNALAATQVHQQVNAPPLKLDAAKEQQLTEILSIVSSAYAFPYCEVVTPRDAEGAELLARLLLRLLSAATATLRSLALHTCRALASSAEGRTILSMEARVCPADSSDRSCFMKLAYNTLGAVMNMPQFGGGSSSPSAAAAASSPSAAARRGSIGRNSGGGLVNSRNNTPARRSNSASAHLHRGPSSASVVSTSNSAIMFATPSGSTTSRLPHHLSPEFHIGVDIVSVTIAKGGEHFAAAVVKQRCVENVETYMLHMARARQPIPIAFYRFLAAVSFSSEVQPILCKRSELLTLLYEMASMTISGQFVLDENATYGGGRGGDSRGSSNAMAAAQQHYEKSSLALLAIRNVCFFPATKIQLCQDSRIMMLLKDCLAASPSAVNGGANGVKHIVASAASAFASSSAASSSVFAGRSVIAAGASGPTALTMGSMPALELYRRQQLAISAMAALVHNNQRAKSYVRGVLSQPPVVDLSAFLLVETGAGGGAYYQEGEGDGATGGASPSPAPFAGGESSNNPYRSHAAAAGSGGGDGTNAMLFTAHNSLPVPTTAFEFYQRSTAESAAFLQAL